MFPFVSNLSFCILPFGRVGYDGDRPREIERETERERERESETKETKQRRRIFLDLLRWAWIHPVLQYDAINEGTKRPLVTPPLPRVSGGETKAGRHENACERGAVAHVLTPRSANLSLQQAASMSENHDISSL